jgi:hypothetical protein
MVRPHLDRNSWPGPPHRACLCVSILSQLNPHTCVSISKTGPGPHRVHGVLHPPHRRHLLLPHGENEKKGRRIISIHIDVCIYIYVCVYRCVCVCVCVRIGMHWDTPVVASSHTWAAAHFSSSHAWPCSDHTTKTHSVPLCFRNSNHTAEKKNQKEEYNFTLTTHTRPKKTKTHRVTTSCP